MTAPRLVDGADYRFAFVVVAADSSRDGRTFFEVPYLLTPPGSFCPKRDDDNSTSCRVGCSAR
jgi:hypothetical protein